jgi:general secretion pathway protein I
MWSWTGSPEPSQSQSRSKGFTLIEVLVALAILALSLVVLLQLFGGGLRAVGGSERYLMATMLARSVLDDMGTETPIVTGEKSADIGEGYRWTTRIAPSQTISPVKDGKELRVPYEVQVEISWNGRPVTTLTTLRLVTQPQSAP